MRRRGAARGAAARPRAARDRCGPRRQALAGLPNADGRGGGRGRDSRPLMPLTVGTAGHIDHGKTWLVRALTGKDTDRLPEEQARGISIDLGYAPLDLPDGRRLSVIDVPGHERFVRTMVAGASGIDLFLLVIDAGEGARPQTLEHLAVLRLLAVEHGVVAVTKSDAVDAETLELALEQARELVPGAEVVAVSAKTGAGLDELRGALARAADRSSTRRPGTGATRLWIDRVFTLRGHRHRRHRHALVGVDRRGRRAAGRAGRARRPRAQRPGARPARSSAPRPGSASPSRSPESSAARPRPRRRARRAGSVRRRPTGSVSSLEELAEIPADVKAHLGTADVRARVVRAGRFAQLRLAEPVVAARGDRVVLRTDTTVGGALVLDPSPPRALDAARLELLEHGDLAATVHEPVPARRSGTSASPDGVERAGDWLFSRAWRDELRAELARRLAAADPLDPGIDAPPEPWAARSCRCSVSSGAARRLYAPGHRGVAREPARRRREPSRRSSAPPERTRSGPRPRPRRVPRARRPARPARRRDARSAPRPTSSPARRSGRVRAPRVDHARASARPARRRAPRSAQLLLLERLDADGVTRRTGNERVLRRASGGAR